MLETDECVDAFLFLPAFIDLDIFKSWIQGLSETEVAHQIQNVAQFRVTKGQLETEVQSNFSEFRLLEPDLQTPDVFLTSMFGGPFQIDADTKLTLVQMYYELDATVLRELLGRKLSRKDRRDLEDTSDSTGYSMASCQRQFDNVRRVVKHCDEAVGGGSGGSINGSTCSSGQQRLADVICAKFCLGPDLARMYVAAVFLNHHRFETNKKKQSLITFSDFQKCVDDIMVNWTYSSRESSQLADVEIGHPAELDFQFLQDLRAELKGLSERKEHADELKKMTNQKLKELFGESTQLDVDGTFKQIYKGVLSIGSNLIHSKAVKDLFIDIIDKIIEPSRQSGMSLKDMDNFQEAFCQSFLEYGCIKRQHIMRFLQTLFNCVMIFYHRMSLAAD